MKRKYLWLMLFALFIAIPCNAANEVLHKADTQISFADHAADFSCSVAASCLEQGTPTDVQLDMTSVADAAARQSAKVDLGATRPMEWALIAAVEMAATPTTGEVIEFYWNSSPDSTAANGNSGYTTGSDAAYAGGVATLAEGVAQLDFIGVLVCSADATTTVQTAVIGTFSPRARYGSLVVKNESGAAFHSDAVETHMVMNPVTTEIQ